jgi:hypothetical protein
VSNFTPDVRKSSRGSARISELDLKRQIIYGVY